MYITGDKYAPGAITKVSFVQANDKVGAENDYVLQFRLAHAIPSKGMIKVIVPIGTNDRDMKYSNAPAFDVSIHGQAENKNVVISSIESSSGETAYTIESSNGFFNSQIDVNSGSYIQIRVRSIRNPIYLGTSTGSIKIRTMNSDKKVIDEISSGFEGVSKSAAVVAFESITTSS